MRLITINKERGAVDFPATLKTITLWLQTCADGKYTISMKKVQQKRSNRQNNYLWACFGVIAKAWSEGTGRVFTTQEVHDAYCTLLLPVDTPRGRVPGSTSSLTMEKMSWFIDSIREDAKEYGVELPSPEDEFFTAWAEEYVNEQ